ncbi:MAG: hypothetical protein AAB510_03485 [Patescibacteria group bacterium]
MPPDQKTQKVDQEEETPKTDENTLENEETPLSPSPEEPTLPPHEATGGQEEPAFEKTATSETTDALPEALEAPPEGFIDESNNIAPSDSTLTEPEKEQKTDENQAENESNFEPVSEPEIPQIPQNKPNPEPISEPVKTPESTTAQIPVNEPLAEKPEPPKEQAKPVLVPVILKRSFAIELLIKARNAIQFRKRKKLNRVMSLFLAHSKITNDNVEKLLHVSDATATRYLSILEKEGKIKQNGKTGKGVSYSRI